MNIGFVIKTLSSILLIVCFFMIFPILFALYYAEQEVVLSFVIPMAIAVVLFLLTQALTWRTKSHNLTLRDSMLLVSASWMLSALISSLPFVLSAAIPHFADAFFETMSGFTTTGASILTNIEALPKSILFWRSLTHWLGGMGIVVLTVALLPLLGIGGLQLVKAEAPGPSVDKISFKIIETAKIFWMIYLFFTVAETVLLMVGGLDLFDALTHTFGTLATGGFSPKNSSVGFYHSAYVDIVITVFMVFAGTNFALYFHTITGGWRSVIRNTELKAYLAIFLAATLLIAFSLKGTYSDFGQQLRYAGFQTASILTTTGYATADFASWPLFSQALLFLLMFIGGCSGSTGGGIKVVRIVTLLKQSVAELKLQVRRRAVFSIRLNGLPVKSEIMSSVSGFLVLYLLFLLFTTLVVASGGNDIITSLSSALVTLGNIGPGFGKIGPTSNYAFFPDYIKWFLSFAMMVGRLEIFTVLVLFVPTFWRR